MARVALISLCDEYCLGLRQLVANLLTAGHEADLISLKRYGKRVMDPGEEADDEWQIQVLPGGEREVLSYPFEISQTEQRLFVDLLRRLRPDIVGLSVFSNHLRRAVEITALVRQVLPGTPILWGGPHALLEPRGSAEQTDLVMVGEGDVAMIDLARAIDRGDDLTQVASIAHGTGDAFVQQPLAPLVDDLDSLPFAHHGEEHAFYIEDDQCSGTPPRGSDLHRTHKTMTSRGCPHACSFCILSHQKEVLPESTALRFRSIEHVMRELDEVSARRGHFFLEIYDDIFTMRRDRMEEFFAQYGERVGMPFWCFTHPRYAHDHHLALLRDAGAEFVVMGIESGSDRVADEVFNRRVTSEQVIQAAKRIAHHGLRAYYDVISNNPFEDESDRRQMLALIRALPRPFHLQLVELNFYPNIAIERLRRERGLPRQVNLHEYRLWNAMYHLASAIDIDDDDCERLLSDESLRRDPSLIENLAEQARALADARADADLRERNAVREMERQTARAQALEAQITRHRGLRWVSGRLRRLAGRGSA